MSREDCWLLSDASDGMEYLRTNYGAIRCGQDPILGMASADKGGALVVLGAARDLCLKAF